MKPPRTRRVLTAIPHVPLEHYKFRTSDGIITGEQAYTALEALSTTATAAAEEFLKKANRKMVELQPTDWQKCPIVVALCNVKLVCSLLQ